MTKGNDIAFQKEIELIESISRAAHHKFHKLDLGL
jgi:hypothetical protein